MTGDEEKATPWHCVKSEQADDGKVRFHFERTWTDEKGTTYRTEERDVVAGPGDFTVCKHYVGDDLRPLA